MTKSAPGPHTVRPRAASPAIPDHPGESAPDTSGHLLARLERIVIVALFSAMLVIGSLQVINRYALNLPIWNTELLLPHLFIVMTFLGVAVAFRHRAHIAVDLLPSSLPRAVRRHYLIGLWCIVCLFLVGIIYSSISVILFQIEINAVTNMNYPAAIVTATVPVSCVLSILNIIRFELVPLVKARL